MTVFNLKSYNHKNLNSCISKSKIALCQYWVLTYTMLTEPAPHHCRAVTVIRRPLHHECSARSFSFSSESITTQSLLKLLIFWFHCITPHSSVGKESACNAGDPGSPPESGRSPGEGIGYPLQYSWASLVAQLVKNPLAMIDLGSIPGLGRSPGEVKHYPLQYSGLENSMNCIVHGVTESQTWLNELLLLSA